MGQPMSGGPVSVWDLGDQLPAQHPALPNTQFLVGQFDPYADVEAGKRVVMEHFYRGMRRHFGILMTADLGHNVLGLGYLDADERARVRQQAQSFLAELDSWEG
jgi:deoxyribodipyrimidine photolyase-like uncharacterized protein